MTGSADDYASMFEIPIPGDLTGEEWERLLVRFERQGRSIVDVLEIAERLAFKHSAAGRAVAGRRHKRVHVDRQQATQAAAGYPVLMPLAVTSPKGHIDANHEEEYLVRSSAGLPRLRLVDAGDRLAIWSPVNGGALINPKGAGLRSFGLVGTYARGTRFHATAYGAADLHKGRPVELVREPDNSADGNAVALRSRGASKTFGYVQRGRAASVARRIDSGQELSGVCLWGPGPRRDDASCFVLIGTDPDIGAMTAHLRGEAAALLLGEMTRGQPR